MTTTILIVAVVVLTATQIAIGVTLHHHRVTLAILELELAALRVKLHNSIELTEARTLIESHHQWERDTFPHQTGG